jgi:hypothetical protein
MLPKDQALSYGVKFYCRASAWSAFHLRSRKSKPNQLGKYPIVAGRFFSYQFSIMIKKSFTLNQAKVIGERL